MPYIKILLLFVSLLLVTLAVTVLAGEDGSMEHKKLTPQEEQVIVHKGTETPFSGKFVKHSAHGLYVCKRCDAPLFHSDSKFDSKSGWPSFDDAVKGAIKEVADADGMRTEIVCANCGAHLGHVFVNEGFTNKNTRHCVNSVSLDFKKADTKSEVEKAIFGGGCFWGVEHYFTKEKGVLATQVGYIGGHVENPTYQQVCSGKTGHIEAMEVTYDPAVVDFATLAKLFFEIHDPAQVNRQGPDIGEQYKSAVFYLNTEQKQITEGLIDILRRKGIQVATELIGAGRFWPAETYHQDYYNKKGGTPYCHTRVKRFE